MTSQHTHRHQSQTHTTRHHHQWPKHTRELSRITGTSHKCSAEHKWLSRLVRWDSRRSRVCSVVWEDKWERRWDSQCLPTHSCREDSHKVKDFKQDQLFHNSSAVDLVSMVNHSNNKLLTNIVN